MREQKKSGRSSIENSTWFRQHLQLRDRENNDDDDYDYDGDGDGDAMLMMIDCLLFCVLATSKVISGRVPTCDNAHSWRLYSAAQLGNQAVSTMT